MSSDISYKTEVLWVSNQRFRTLIEFALDVGEKSARSLEEVAFVRLLADDDETALFNGCSFNLDERFQGVAAKKFWAAVFFDVARRIFLRQVGNQDIDSWQPSVICDAHLVGRMLDRAVREQEPDTT